MCFYSSAFQPWFSNRGLCVYEPRSLHKKWNSFKDQYFTRWYRVGQKCNFFLRKTNEACILVINECSSCGFQRRAQSDMENFLLISFLYYFCFNIFQPCSWSVFKMLKQNKNQEREKRIFQIYSFYGFYPPLLLFINVIRLIANSV